jgi:hypothetical protein
VIFDNHMELHDLAQYAFLALTGLLVWRFLVDRGALRFPIAGSRALRQFAS